MKLLHKLWPKLKSNFPDILFFVFLLAIGSMLYINLGRDYLFDWDEGIYGELGRQVVVGRHWLTNYWNGEPWFEKPPGISWVSALGISLLGPSALGARLFMPIIALYTLYMVYRLGRHLGGWTVGAMAAGILATFNLFLGRTRGVNADMPLLASLVTTVVFLLEKRPVSWVALSIVAGVWFKGLAGLLPVLIALPLFLTKSRQYWLLLIGYCLLLIIPWHLYSYFRYGSDFATPYFYEQVVRRATAQIEFHFENRWYYFTYLYENLGLGVLLVAGLGAGISLFTRRHFFLLWWVALPLALFTLAKTRLFWYILPIYPALALLIALAINSFNHTRTNRGVLGILTVGILAQGIYSAGRSVELTKTVVPAPDRLQVAMSLANSDRELFVLVPPSERLAEALLPNVARLGSSFRYGGMPSVVYYYHGPVQFFYNVDTFLASYSTFGDLALVHVDDLAKLNFPYHILTNTPTYVGLGKEVYADR